MVLKTVVMFSKLYLWEACAKRRLHSKIKSHILLSECLVFLCHSMKNWHVNINLITLRNTFTFRSEICSDWRVLISKVDLYFFYEIKKSVSKSLKFIRFVSFSLSSHWCANNLFSSGYKGSNKSVFLPFVSINILSRSSGFFTSILCHGLKASARFGSIGVMSTKLAARKTLVSWSPKLKEIRQKFGI